MNTTKITMKIMSADILLFMIPALYTFDLIQIKSLKISSS